MSEKENFETVLKALESAVQQLESGELSLEDSLVCFESGVRSANACRKILQEMETRVELLLKDRDGQVRVENFQED